MSDAEFAADAAAALAAARARGAWAQTPERSNALALRAMTWIALACGRRVARWVLHPITLYFVLFAPAARRHSKRYLARALGRTARFRDGYRHVYAFTATTLDRLYLLRGRLGLFDIEIEGSDLIDDTLAAGGGAFLFGAHMGSFEVLRAVGDTCAGLRIAMVMYPDNAQMINAALRAIAPDAEPHIIALGRQGSMLAVRDWLDDGGLAGVLADRAPAVPSGRSGELRVDFLGRPAPFNDGPFRLAALLRRRVVFMAGVYSGGNRYRVVFETLADFSEPMTAAQRDARVEFAVHAYAARVETLCREHPYNWFNFHDFWQEDA